MRTTPDIDDDLMRAAKELARREKLSAGQSGVAPAPGGARARGRRGEAGRAWSGFRPFPAGRPGGDQRRGRCASGRRRRHRCARRSTSMS
ncbi:MAG: hypothetical protein MZW92_38495 [Comamonadaceae bacterium]|nr:hypothetical protein [Comamonadaceae bacterium]